MWLKRGCKSADCVFERRQKLKETSQCQAVPVDLSGWRQAELGLVCWFELGLNTVFGFNWDFLLISPKLFQSPTADHLG